MNSTYKAAVVGCGARGSMHIKAYDHIERGEVVGCCDLLKEKADELAEEFKITPYYDVAEMIAREHPDLIHITTPPTARGTLLSQAADARVPACTVEKPLATGVADWRELQEIERAGKTKIAVCHQFRWHDDFVKCQEALRSGAVGEVLFLDISASGSGRSYPKRAQGREPLADRRAGEKATLGRKRHFTRPCSIGSRTMPRSRGRIFVNPSTNGR